MEDRPKQCGWMRHKFVKIWDVPNYIIYNFCLKCNYVTEFHGIYEGTTHLAHISQYPERLQEWITAGANTIVERRERVAKGLCLECGVKPQNKPFKLCRECSENIDKEQQERKQSSSDKRRSGTNVGTWVGGI